MLTFCFSEYILTCVHILRSQSNIGDTATSSELDTVSVEPELLPGCGGTRWFTNPLSAPHKRDQEHKSLVLSGITSSRPYIF